jgi:hypothetical protein
MVLGVEFAIAYSESGEIITPLSGILASGLTSIEFECSPEAVL